MAGTITLVAFEALALITILPLIRNDLGGLAYYGWVISAFSLGALFGIVAAGDQADRIGPVRPFLAGLVLFATGLVIGGAAPSMVVLVAGRALQGIGAGVLPAVAWVCIGRTYPDALRPRVFATLSTAWVVPGVGGPALSVIVAQHFGWRLVLLGLLPLVVAGGAVAIPAMRHLGIESKRPTSSQRLIDGLRVTCAAALVLTALSRHDLVGLGLLSAAPLLGWRPLGRLIPPGTFRAATPMAAAVLVQGLLTFAFFGADTFVPLEVTTIRANGPAVAGLAVTAAILAWTGGAWIQVRLATRWSTRRQVGTGFLVLVAGIATVAAGLWRSSPVALTIAGWGVGGCGIGLAYTPLSIIVLAEAPPEAQGVSSAALQLFEYLGIALGAGIGGTLVALLAVNGSPTAEGIAGAFGVAAAAGCTGLAVARRLPADR